MICPYCQTDNRDDRDACYYCTKDLAMLRLIVNKAKLHYNQGLEFAERGRLDDAIVELKNALDLDASLVNAQVVLGTLYAKQEQFGEAREAWQRALAQDHRYEKAHDYLNKSENAEYVFPVMNRLKRVSLGLMGAVGALLVLALILLVVALHGDPGLAKVSRSAKLLESGDLDKAAQANRLLGEVIEGRPSPVTFEMARSLVAHIQQLDAAARQQQQDRINWARNSITENPYMALQMLNSLDEKKADEAVRQSIKRVRTSATEAINQRIRQYADQFFAGTLPFELFRDEAQRYLQMAGRSEDVAQLLERARDMHRKQLEAEAIADVTQAPLAEAPGRIVKWEARSIELGELLRKRLDERLAGEATRTETEVAKLLEQGQTADARQKVEDLARTYQTAQRSAPDQLLASLRGRIDDAQRQQTLAGAKESYQNKNWEEFLTRTASLDQLTTRTEEQATFTQMRLEAQQAFANDTWNWFQARDNQFSDGTVTAGDAGRAVEVFERVVTHLPEKQVYARATVLLYTAAAYQKLGQPDRARELLNRIGQEYPKSPVAKSAARELKKLEPAPPAQTATATAGTPPAIKPPDEGRAKPQPIKPVKKKQESDE